MEVAAEESAVFMRGDKTLSLDADTAGSPSHLTGHVLCLLTTQTGLWILAGLRHNRLAALTGVLCNSGKSQ